MASGWFLLVSKTHFLIPSSWYKISNAFRIVDAIPCPRLCSGTNLRIYVQI